MTLQEPFSKLLGKRLILTACKFDYTCKTKDSMIVDKVIPRFEDELVFEATIAESGARETLIISEKTCQELLDGKTIEFLSGWFRTRVTVRIDKRFKLNNETK